MKIKITSLGEERRHSTSFEQNAIHRLNSIAAIKSVRVLYDETLYAVDDKCYVLLSITTKSGDQTTMTSDGSSSGAAFMECINLCETKLRARRGEMAVVSGIDTELQVAV